MQETRVWHLIPCCAAPNPTCCSYWRLGDLEPVLCNKRSYLNEKPWIATNSSPIWCNQRKSLCGNKHPAQQKIIFLKKSSIKINNLESDPQVAVYHKPRFCSNEAPQCHCSQSETATVVTLLINIKINLKEGLFHLIHLYFCKCLIKYWDSEKYIVCK